MNEHDPVHHGLATLLRKCLPFIAPFRSRLALVAVGALALGGVNALEPLALKYVIDGLGGPNPTRAVLAGVGWLLGLMLLRELVASRLDIATWRVRIGVNYRMTRAMVERLHSLPLSFHRDQSVGALMTRMDRGIQGSVTAFGDLAFNVFPALVYFAVALCVMVRLDWRLTLLVLAFAPLAPLIGAWAASEQTRREQGLMDRWTRLYARFNEVLGGIIVVKSFAMEEVEKRRFLDGVDEANGLVIKGVARDATTNAAKNLATTLARILAIAAGAWLVSRGEITIGTLVAFLGYIGSMMTPVQAMTGTYQTLRKGTVALRTMFDILDRQDSLGDAPDASDPGTIRGEVRFDRVTFGYRSGKPVLCDVSLHARPGETIALVGSSGAGKSTMMSLLQRLYDPDQGRVLVDGHDVRSIKQQSLRMQIGAVLQDNLLFSDSIRDNIAFGCPGASDDEIVRAAKAAHAHQFIERLPDGYATPVGDRGCKLSAGQRQRVAIARALLRNPAILVLDEPTSALDAESEALVQEALQTLQTGRTTFVIAHRLSTIANADRIYVFDEGRIAESGTHDQLVAREGIYASLVRRQTLRGTGWEVAKPSSRELLPQVAEAVGG